MDGIVLNLDGGVVSFEFIRNTGTPAAVSNGDVESGTFIYTSRLAINALRNYENIAGDLSNFVYPTATSGATYTYTAVNNNSGVITMVATGNYGFPILLPDNTSVINNNSFVMPFFSHSNAPGDFLIPDTLTTRVVEIAVTFADRGGFVTSDTITFRLPESPFVSSVDTVRISSVATLATLGAIPLNYNPIIAERAPSRIAPATLSNRLMVATNGIPDVTKNFNIQFVADRQTIPGSSTLDNIEVGRGLLSVFDPALGRLSAVPIALDYTWQRIAGTDNGTLILSNIQPNPAFPFLTSLNGRMSLSFTGLESGRYNGAADADTPDAADVTGSFFLPLDTTPGVVTN